jgi:hypothetical protein
MHAGGQSIVLIRRLLGTPGIKIHNLNTALLFVLRGASVLGQDHQTVHDSPGKPGRLGRRGNQPYTTLCDFENYQQQHDGPQRRMDPDGRAGGLFQS